MVLKSMEGWSTCSLLPVVLPEEPCTYMSNIHTYNRSDSILFFKIKQLIYFWLCWVFVSACRLSLVGDPLLPRLSYREAPVGGRQSTPAPLAFTKLFPGEEPGSEPLDLPSDLPPSNKPNSVW